MSTVVEDYYARLLPTARQWVEDTFARHASGGASFISIKSERVARYFSREWLLRVRICAPMRMPAPPASLLEPLRTAARPLDYFELGSSENLRSVTLKNLVLIRPQEARYEPLQFHALVHTVQWEHLGVDKFIRTYTGGALVCGRPGSPLEQQAYKHQAEFERGREPYDVARVVREELDRMNLKL